jgi:hypothetical protein
MLHFQNSECGSDPCGHVFSRIQCVKKPNHLMTEMIKNKYVQNQLGTVKYVNLVITVADAIV